MRSWTKRYIRVGEPEREGEGYIHRTSESIHRGAVHQVQGLLVILVLEDIDGDHWSKDLVYHSHRLGILRKNDSRLDEETLGVVTCTSYERVARENKGDDAHRYRQ